MPGLLPILLIVVVIVLAIAIIAFLARRRREAQDAAIAAASTPVPELTEEDIAWRIGASWRLSHTSASIEAREPRFPGSTGADSAFALLSCRA